MPPTVSLPMPPLPLVTRRLSLRDYIEGDADAVAAYAVDQSYWQNQGTELPRPEQIKSLVQWAVQEQRLSTRTNYYLAATRKDSGELIGEAVLRIVNPEARQAELGFGVVPKHWRQGYATEIGSALLDLAFNHFKLHRVAAQCAPENKPSIRVLQKLGMAREGLIRDVCFARGRWWSSAAYSMLENEYAKIKGVQRG
ncbi:MAG: GNAT family N-acetyltransferase [Rhodobacteraceae bacterium]|nr:GNAT family N-acetyltransferase [Paracoccaceae bacterium]